MIACPNLTAAKITVNCFFSLGTAVKLEKKKEKKKKEKKEKKKVSLKSRGIR